MGQCRAMPKGCTAVGTSVQHSLGKLRSRAKRSLACSASRTVEHQQQHREPLELAVRPLVSLHLLVSLRQEPLVLGKELSSLATEQEQPQERRPFGWKRDG